MYRILHISKRTHLKAPLVQTRPGAAQAPVLLTRPGVAQALVWLTRPGAAQAPVLLTRPGAAQTHTANEGPVKIPYKCLVPIYVFPEIKLLFPKPKCNVLSPNSYTHISWKDLYISRIGLPILLQEICGLILGIYKLLTDI
jgi:hypothetical protein